MYEKGILMAQYRNLSRKIDVRNYSKKWTNLKMAFCFLTILTLAQCKSDSGKFVAGGLAGIDVSQEYPEKELCIQDNVSGISLPGGLQTMISGIGIYYPDGTQTQRVGIVPDVEIEPTINGIKRGKDEVLEKAIEIIKKQ